MELLNRGARCDLPYINIFRARPLDKICGLSISIGLSKPADVRFLIDLAKAAICNGGDVNAQDEHGCRVLNGAACRGNRPALMEFLISHGAVVNPPAREHSGITPLVNAARGESRKDSSGDHSQRMESVRLLLNHGALIDAATSYGYTALHSAYAANHFDVAAQLERAGADTTLRTPKGELPRDLIKKEPHDAYLKQRWERRKYFVYFLRDYGLARGASGSASEGLLGRRASLLQVLAADALQSAIVSYL
jgi:ankyrin repeat protein